VFVSLSTAFVYFYSDQIKNILLNELDRKVKKEVSVKIDEVQLTWWTHFPNVSLELKNTVVSQQIREENDTLIKIEHIGLGLDISELIAKDFTIEKIYLKKGFIHMKMYDGEFNNFSIFKSQTADSTNKIALDLEQIKVDNINFIYEDFTLKHLYNIYFSKNKLKLKYSETEISSFLSGNLKINNLRIKGKNYFENRAIDSDIKLSFNPETQKYQLYKSSLVINGGTYDLDGFYTHNHLQELNLAFKAHEGQLSSLSSLLPPYVSSSINKYKTKGLVYFDGTVKGNLANSKQPAIAIKFGFKDASFTDPVTNQSITKANLTGHYTNGISRNSITSKLSVNDFSINLQGGTTKGSFTYTNFLSPQIDLKLDANMPFSSLVNFTGNNHLHSPTGNLSAKVEIKAPLDLFLTDHKNTKIISKGELRINNVGFGIKNSDLNCRAINGHFLINKTDLGIVNFEGKAGNSDFKLDGMISQFIPFIFGYGDKLLLQGEFNSTFIDLDQLLSQNIKKEQTQDELKQNYNFKISPWLSFDLDCTFDKVKFRRLKGKDQLHDVNGEIHLKDQLFNYDHISFIVASGIFENKGFIDGKDPNNIQLYNECNLKAVDVQEFFYVFENFNQDFITDKNLKGKISGTYKASLLFDHALRLKLEDLEVNTDLTITYGELINFTPLKEMNKYLSKKKYKKYVQNSNLSNIVFSELKTNISISNGTILIPETTIKNSVTRINLSGTHTFDNQIDYQINFPLVNYSRVNQEEDINDSKYLHIFMDISGTTDKYIVDVKEKKILQDLGQVILQSIKPQEVAKEEPTTIELDLDDDENTIDLE